MRGGAGFLHCPGCSVEVPEGSRFCGKCGAALPRACPNCGHAVPSEDSFCSKCGASVLAGSGTPPPPATRLTAPTTATGSTAERRQLTIMFCDMVGSSALSTRLDPEEQGDVIAAFHACCANEVKSLGGMVAQYLGDGVLAYFGYPTAHENDAERAILAGLAIIKAVGTLNTVADVAVQTRIAIGSGVVVVGDLIRQGVTQENAAIGETTNLVARLQAIAEPNSLVISPVTYRLVGALFDYQDLGRHSLKGFSEPVHVRQVLGRSKVESRFEAQHQAGTSPLLGREEELGLLVRRWDETKRGEGRVVLLTGEPGIGKSRLANALREHLRSAPHTPLSYFCSPLHQGSSLYPFIGQLNRAAGIEREDSAEVKLDKLQSLLTQSSSNLAKDMALIAALLSIPGGDRYPLPEMTPQRRKERTLAALLEQVKRLAAHQPILILFEDLHWIDPTSLELLSLAIEHISKQRVLLLATARSEFTPSWPNNGHISTLPLNRLGRFECEALIGGLAGGKSLPAEVANQIITRTDGVPLFIEELTKTVLESGLLHEGDDRFELMGALPPLAIPSTLHGSLLARLDRLASVKDVAQIGAVIGREFSYALIAAAAALSEQSLRGALSQLVAAELIYQRGVPPDATYQFKHALVQDASYASLVRSRRQQLHSQIARALEQRFPDIVSTEPETLAHHLTEAGLTESAVPYWLKAGQRATVRSADRESIRHLQSGLKLIASLPDGVARDRQELEFQIAMGTPLIAVEGYASPKVESTCERAIVLSEKLDDTEGLFRSLYAQSTHCNTRSQSQRALALAERCYALGNRVGDRVMQIMALRAAGAALLWLGELSLAQSRFERVLALYDAKHDRSLAPRFIQDPSAGASTALALISCIQGFPEQGVRMQAEALRCAADLNHVNTSGYVHFFAGAEVELILRNVSAVLTHTQIVRALAVQHGVAAWRHIASILEGWALSWSGGQEVGTSLMREGLRALRAQGATVHSSYFMSLLAQIDARAGEVEPSLQLAVEARTLAEETGEHVWLAEQHRIEGELRHAAGYPLIDVEECFRRALGVSRRQGARMFELRAATGLAQLWCDQGRNIEARDLLAPIIGWFTEGFDTVDLKDAKALLNRLNA
jgi:class 3 adenylate cyclase/predicted ATPase